MKTLLLLKLALGAALLSGAAQATTIVAGGGLNGRVFIGFGGGPLSSISTTIEVGTFDGVNSGSFQKFAATDATPMTFMASGQWMGNFADTSTDANAFNGQQVWFKITNSVVPSMNFLTSGQLFPVNGGGVGDSLTIDSRNLTTIVSFHLDLISYIDAPGNRIFLGVPEPTVAAMGAFAGLLAMRRRRQR